MEYRDREIKVRLASHDFNGLDNLGRPAVPNWGKTLGLTVSNLPLRRLPRCVLIVGRFRVALYVVRTHLTPFICIIFWHLYSYYL
jgi:hypothetical protein